MGIVKTLSESIHDSVITQVLPELPNFRLVPFVASLQVRQKKTWIISTEYLINIGSCLLKILIYWIHFNILSLEG